MSNYKGYLPGMNPNRTRKIFQDDDDRYYAYESSTGTFVNNLGQEVKTAKEAIAFNDKLDAEYKRCIHRKSRWVQNHLELNLKE